MSNTMAAHASTPAEVVVRCDTVMAHAWMVRTFVKHSEEAEEYPELHDIVRAVFDASRALETRLDDPAKYLHMLRKKLGKLGRAAEKFRGQVAEVSEHTNFKQAVISMDACVAELRELLAAGEAALTRASESAEEE
jgi:hypothetical protein